jgi:predicted metal-dependent enzyme (double-stranded beta helix superfamily)
MAERTFGDVATRMLFENDRVRVWEMDLAPGESSDVHEHTLDYLLIQLEGDMIAGIFEEDTKGAYPPKGGIETAKNIGTQRYREILVELKE